MRVGEVGIDTAVILGVTVLGRNSGAAQELSSKAEKITRDNIPRDKCFPRDRAPAALSLDPSISLVLKR
jgi:hypothetical protein